ncbi:MULTISPECIES: MoxR family ATPase [Moorena]|uniref:MoxR-like ATPase n=1 Tax=Moorena producens 3L TaxID=489825 RepID=F4XXA9_9CYAN|nr:MULTISPECIES: MoxR family ATPase [Moorena]EGJ30768.1 MoxR-like ATPase [Moorena producens 3L]NEP65424.1 MoxR family ATPase [Moorena sp. SIO3A5]OLT64324.1 AAA family ATPase [Moorena producens 3L]
MSNKSWKIFRGTPEQPHNGIERLPDPPSWRKFDKKERGTTYQTRPEEIELVNAALYLRRPLLVTGKPGTGKTSLAYAVAQELQLGEVLRWNITTRSHLQQGLYSYDAIGRLQDAKGSSKDNLGEIGKYIQLGPLGTALLPSNYPRVLLIDEMDKSDIDLPNDLLTIFEEGEFEIPELTRISDQFPDIVVKTWDNQITTISNGKVTCQVFPFVVLTSNGEREFPPAFLRRCLRLDLREPTPEELEAIVKAHLGDTLKQAEKIIEKFLKRRDKGDLATDQLLNAIYLLTNTVNTEDSPMGDSQEEDKDHKKARLIDRLLQYLSST